MKTVVAGALGECVHVAGVSNFLRLAHQSGWRTVFLGPAVPVEAFVKAIEHEKADLVGVSYRLTPETGERLLGEFAEATDRFHSKGIRFAFGGTPPVAERARNLGFFDKVFDGTETIHQVMAYLKGDHAIDHEGEHFPQTTLDRIRWKSPYPLIRHHFGLPDLETTRIGIQRIAEAEVLDVVSLGTDQDAQENFFHPDKQIPRRYGAGGVPVRTREDYAALYQASQRGNFPLIRTYTGTDNFIQLAEMYVETLHIAWPAIPLFWFNQMDGRGPWDLEGSIREHQRLMTWYGKRGLPVEVNEPHHWGMRDAPDVLSVVAAYLSAYNARAMGVQDYISQMMFNSPPGLSDAMDLAKMLASLKLTDTLAEKNFRIWRQTRTGLLSYPTDEDAARAHLSASIYLQMAVSPHIVHVVGYSEADHAATASDVIQSCKMAQRVIKNGLGAPDMTQDKEVQKRVTELVLQARITLQAIRSLGSEKAIDPFIDPSTLTQAVQAGILDAPQLRNNPYGQGKIATRIDTRGACIAIDPHSGEHLDEKSRLSNIMV